MDGGEEVARQLVVPGGDAAKILEATEHSLDDIAAFVSDLIVSMGMFSGRIGRNDGLDPALGEFGAQAFSIISSVGQKTAWMSDHADQAACANQIVGVARRDQEGQGTADIVCQRMDFGRLPATRAANGVVEGPPFAPAAERCALM